MPTTLRLAPLLPLFLACAAAAAADPAPATRGRPPNIVLIVVDDLGYGELGCQGNPQIPTPHIDSIAKAGVRFTQGYVTAANCSPSRAGLMTGRYQTRFGHELNVTGTDNLRPEVGLPSAERTLADRLKAAGYATGLVGKWHLGTADGYHPHRRGFDEFFGFLHEGHTYAPHWFPGLVSHLRVNEPPYDQDNPLLRGTNAVLEPANLTTAFSREAATFVERHRDRPFFLYLAYNAIHSPMQASPGYFDRFRDIPDIHRRVFAAMLAELDDGVGTVLGKLRELSLERDTLVLFVSDNGGPTAELTSGNGPLRGGKGQLFEGGIRVPFLVRWPAALPAGRTYDRPAISLDLTATALAAAGVPVPKESDGVDLVPHLTGRAEGPPHERLFWRQGRNIALRKGDLKLVRQSAPNRPGEFQLFDLAADPGEQTDLAASRPEVARAMREELDRMNAEMVPPLWEPKRGPATRAGKK